jgi:hypothetical protein
LPTSSTRWGTEDYARLKNQEALGSTGFSRFFWESHYASDLDDALEGEAIANETGRPIGSALMDLRCSPRVTDRTPPNVQSGRIHPASHLGQVD